MAPFYGWVSIKLQSHYEETAFGGGSYLCWEIYCMVKGVRIESIYAI